MNNRLVCHNFCNGIDKGKKGHNVFFNESGIYSYGSHYCMGFFAEYNDLKILFINSSGYSHSTAKHLSYLRQAINENYQDIVIEIPFINFFNTHIAHYNSNYRNGFNSDDFKKLKHKKEFFQKILNDKRKNLEKDYEGFFKVRKIYGNTGEILSNYNEKQKELISLSDKLNLKYIYLDFDKEKIKKHIEYRKKRNAEIDIIQKERNEARETQRKIDNLKNTIKHNLDFNYPSRFYKLEVIENQIKSQSGSISLDCFSKWFKFWYNKLINRETFKKENVLVGDYKGLTIKKNGIVQVGCSKFFPDEIYHCGKELNLI